MIWKLKMGKTVIKNVISEKQQIFKTNLPKTSEFKNIFK